MAYIVGTDPAEHEDLEATLTGRQTAWGKRDSAGILDGDPVQTPARGAAKSVESQDTLEKFRAGEARVRDEMLARARWNADHHPNPQARIAALTYLQEHS